MSAKVFDVLIYCSATIVILAIISTATQAERKHKEEIKKYDPIEVKEPLIKEEPDLTSEIVFTSQPNCAPCRAFERECVPALREAGWRMTKSSPDSRGTPSFDLRLDGNTVASKTGYRSRKSFFQWIRNAIARNR